MEFIESIAKTIREVNDKFNARFRVVDSKSSKAVVEFDSEKIVGSLVSSGVPLLQALRVLDRVEMRIFAEHESGTLSTSEIRDFIRSSLHCLEAYGVPAHSCQEWGDTYVRKYGNPHGKIRVVHRDGRFEELDFEYVKSVLLDEILSEICNMSVADVQAFFSYRTRVDMANELMRVIQDLGIYRIHHRTLLLLAKDLALQPPHPWFATNTQILDNVKYDIEQAGHHLARMHQALEAQTLPDARNSFRECLHHTSSAILAFYSEMLGCGDLATFYNLGEVLKSFHKSDEIIRVAGSKIHLLPQDLALQGSSLPQLTELWSKLHHMLNLIFNESALEESFPFMERFFNLAGGIVSGRYELIRELETVSESEAKNKGALYEDVVCRILGLCPDLHMSRNQRIRGKEIDIVIEHNLKTLEFQEIKKFIYVECKNEGAKTDIEVIEKLGVRVHEKSPRYCNTGIVVSSRGFTRGAREEAIKLFDKGTLILLLSNRDLYEMIETDIATYLGTKIDLLFFGKVE